jgi:alpha-L-rhamnosidase
MNRLIAVIISCCLFLSSQGQSSVYDLKCDYLNNPVGIDNPHPRFTWKMSDNRNDILQSAYQLIVGTDSLEVLQGNGNSWMVPETNAADNLVEYKGKPLQPFTRYYWTVRAWNNHRQQTTAAVASFETGMMQMGNWKGTWISDTKNIQVKPAPYFRKTFNTTKKIKSARAYIVVAGLYELYINGQEIGDQRLNPMYTRFDARNLYVTYDVTEALQSGRNAIGVVLGNGWYNHQSMAVWNFERAPWRDRPAFCLDLRITYEDGSVETITSDKSWKTALSPIVYNSIYTGQHYDARKEQPGWNRPDFDDSQWERVINRKAPSGNIVAQVIQPIRYVEKLSPVTIAQKTDTSWLVNFGKNISGITQLTLDGDSTTVIRVIHAERLNKEGNIDQSNVDYFLSKPTRETDPFATDIYWLNGKGPQTFAPKFDYKGFQYAYITSNKPIRLTKENIVAYFMHSDVPPVGNMNSSNELLNKIYAATNAAYLSNLLGYPTDCPQREKNGWTGDAHIASEMGLYNFEAITVYEKWLADLRDEQQPNGVLPSIVPTGGWGYEWGNGPDWTSAIAIIPWNVYLFYGDTKILRDNYDNIKRYVDHITDLYPGGLTDWGLGDWAPLKSKSPVELTSSTYYYVDADILARTAKILNKPEDDAKYTALAKKIKEAINAKYLNREKALYGSGYQTELSVPLYWGIVPDSLKQRVAANLADSVAANKYFLDVGILGAKAILSALSDNGQAEAAYRLAAQQEFPSWGWWIRNGATTLYENWNITLERDLSLNHIMFGEIGAWFFKGIAGIKPDEKNPGFKNVMLTPNFVNELTHFTATHKGPYGNIISSWKRTGKTTHYQVTIPANSSAIIRFPQLKNKSVYKENKKINNPEGHILSSGYYEFIIK